MKTILTFLILLLVSDFSYAASSTVWRSQPGQFGQFTITSSTTLAPQSGNKYGPGNVADGNSQTAWVEGVDGYGVNQWIQISYDSPMTFQTILINSGYSKNNSVFYKNSRPKKIRVEAGSHTKEYVLSDTMAEQKIKLPQKVTARFVKLTILSVYPGSKYMDTCISELSVDLEEHNYQ